MKAWHIGIAAVAVFVAVGTLVVTLSAGSGAPTRVSLDGVSDQDLADYGIELMEPDQQPEIDAATAEQAAKSGVPDAEARVKETVLVHLLNQRADPPIDELAWAVNFDPITIQAIPPLGPGQYRYCPGHPLYSVVFIDAESGSLLFGTQRSMLNDSESIEDCPTSSDPNLTPTTTPES